MLASVLLRRRALPSIGRLTPRFITSAAASPRRVRRKAPLPAPKRTYPPINLTPEETNILIASVQSEFFETAVKDGVIKLGYKDAIEVARKCILAATNGDSPTSIKLSEVTGKDPSDIARVVHVLRRSASFGHVADWVTQSLAAEKEVISTIFVNLSRLNKSYSRPVVEKTRSFLNLKEIAEEGRSPQAMVLYGKILQRDKQLTEAAQWFKKAMAISKPIKMSLSDDAILNKTIPRPWAAFSSVKQELGQDDGVVEALTTGAEVYDDVSAYKELLPEIKRQNDLDKYEKYLTKSAMDNDPAACYMLGSYYLTNYILRNNNPITSGGNKDKQENNESSAAGKIRFGDQYPISECRQTAIEWYELAIAGNYGRAALVLASLFRQENKLEHGLKYLDIAADDETCAKETKLLRRSWNDPEFKFDPTSLMHLE